jgi:hypothetical protein
MDLFSFSSISLGASNSTPKYNAGDSIFEWVVSINGKKLQRIRKSTMAITNSIDISANDYNNIAYGTPAGVNYIYYADANSTKQIIRYSSSVDNPITTKLVYTITQSTGAIAPYTINSMYCRYIWYKNGYLWAIPSTTLTSTLGTYIARIQLENDTVATNFDFNTTTSTTNARLTIYDISPSSVYNISKIYIYGNYVFVLYNSGANSCNITKFSQFGSPSSGIYAPTINTLVYTTTGITDITSDNSSYIWMAKDSTSSSVIYRMSIDFSNNVSEASPTTGITSIATGLKSIFSILYGAGYLWATGVNTGTQAAQLIRINTTTNTVISTIPLIATPYKSSISSMEIYNEFLWLVDNGQNAALLKMKIYIPCFKEGTKILCLNPQMKEEYIPIQNIRKGYLIKTLKNGFVPVAMIGKSKIENPGNKERIKNCLYKCSKQKYSDLFEDLYITGCHSILVDYLTEPQWNQTVESLGKIFKTDDKYRLMAYLDDNAEPYDGSGTYTIWHLALENTDYYMNYGIYANGLLVESTSKRYMKELSGMELID